MKSSMGENPTALNLEPQMGGAVSLSLFQPLIETEGRGIGCVHSIPGSGAFISARPNLYLSFVQLLGVWRGRQQKSLAASELQFPTLSINIPLGQAKASPQPPASPYDAQRVVKLYPEYPALWSHLAPLASAFLLFPQGWGRKVKLLVSFPVQVWVRGDVVHLCPWSPHSLVHPPAVTVLRI